MFDKGMMVTSPRAWREYAMTFCNKAERGAARHAVKVKVRTSKIRTRGKRRERRNQVITLTKQRYKKMVGWWDDVPSDEADSDGERMLLEGVSRSDLDADHFFFDV